VERHFNEIFLRVGTTAGKLTLALRLWPGPGPGPGVVAQGSVDKAVNCLVNADESLKVGPPHMAEMTLQTCLENSCPPQFVSSA
jgi:hypothetical protein